MLWVVICHFKSFFATFALFLVWSEFFRDFFMRASLSDFPFALSQQHHRAMLFCRQYPRNSRRARFTQPFFLVFVFLCTSLSLQFPFWGRFGGTPFLHAWKNLSDSSDSCLEFYDICKLGPCIIKCEWKLLCNLLWTSYLGKWHDGLWFKNVT